MAAGDSQSRASATARVAYERDCFWTAMVDPNVVNAAYPDTGANYWTGAYSLPPGAQLVFRGQYPHARYMSFNTYDLAGRPTDSLNDVEIAPDPGSSDPFFAGARRDISNRSYTVTLVAGVPPAQRAPNTLYSSQAGQPSSQGTLIYRDYLPDQGQDPSGGVGLPRVALRLADGTELSESDACRVLELNAPPTVNDVFKNSSLPALPVAYPAQNPPRWFAFFNLARSQCDVYLTPTPLADLGGRCPADQTGGYFANRDNAYIYSVTNRAYGPVLVLRGRAPTTPRTIAGERVMGAGQLRYWSICENEPLSTRYIACLYDEQAVLGPKRALTVVISTPAQRPRNATQKCGVNWLPWGATSQALLILRHMLPDPTFAQAIQRITNPTQSVSATLGAYLPRGTYYASPQAFERTGCAAAAARGHRTPRRRAGHRTPRRGAPGFTG